MSGAKKPVNRELHMRPPKSNRLPDNYTDDDVATLEEYQRERSREGMVEWLALDADTAPEHMRERLDEFVREVEETRRALYGDNTLPLKPHHVWQLELDLFRILSPLHFEAMLRAHDHEQQVEKQRATSVLSAIEKVRSALADLEKADDYPNDPDINKRIEHHNTHDQLVYRPRPRTIKQREVADEWALNHDPAFRHAQTDHAALKARFVWRGLTGDDQQRYTTAIANLRKSLDTLEARNMRGLRNAKRTTDAPRLNHRAKQSLLQTLTELCFAWTAASSVIHMRPHLSLNTSRATSKAKRAVRALVNKALGVAKPECIVEAPIPTNSDDYKTITNALRALFASQDPAATS